MRLYLVQHGEAVQEEIDPDRPLTDRGQEDIARLAAWLSAKGVTVGQILHSGKTRARQTAETLEELLPAGRRIQEDEDLRPNDSPEAFMQRVRYFRTDTLVAGHMPFVLRAVSVALTGAPDRRLLEFTPGSIACIERDESGPWKLILFARPDAY